MTQFTSSILTRLSSSLRSAVLGAAVGRIAPLLAAAALVGCASSAHHRAGALASEAHTPKTTPAPLAAARSDQQPTARESSASSEATKEQSVAASPVFKDAASPVFKADGTGEANDERSGERERFRDEAGETQDEATPGPSKFTDDAAPAGEERAFVQPFADDQASANDDRAVGRENFSDEAARAEDDSAAPQRFTDDAGMGKEEEFGSSQQFADEAAAPQKDEAATPEVFKDDHSGTASEELVTPPENFIDEEKLAQVEEVKPAPATILPLTITVEADPLFDFDRYAIRPESRKKLDALVQQLEGVSYGEVIAVGFADPIGSKLYNQNLSQRRAASVEEYLLSKGIPADRVRVEARGQTEEFASYRNCDGRGKQNLIDCLQPDRRVEVTVTPGKQQ
jgi:outer membrane protein OmpA-like peptidoglycan-associated protein